MGFKIDVNGGYADFVMHQLYENKRPNPLELVFIMPVSDTFTLNKIEVDFVLFDGSIKTIVSRVEVRSKAEKKYEDKVAAGQTAILASLPKIDDRQIQKTMRIQLGNMPPKSIAFLRAYCNQ